MQVNTRWTYASDYFWTKQHPFITIHIPNNPTCLSLYSTHKKIIIIAQKNFSHLIQSILSEMWIPLLLLLLHYFARALHSLVLCHYYYFRYTVYLFYSSIIIHSFNFPFLFLFYFLYNFLLYIGSPIKK